MALLAEDDARSAAECKSRNDASSALKTASAAHEVKNFAECLTNLVYLLQRNPTLDDDARKYVQLIENQLEQMRYVLNQMLARYRQIANPTAVPVSNLLDTVLRFHADRIAAKRVQVEKRYEGDGIVNAQAEDLRQVFSNLVLNAVQALRPNGGLTIHIHRSHRWNEREAVGVRVAIADNGVGIPAEHRSRIFRQSLTTKGEKGSGLGLLMTAKIIQEHGGTLRFRSSTKPGRSGTIFSLFLPGAVADHDQQFAASTHIGERLQTLRRSIENTLPVPDQPQKPLLSPKENRAIAAKLVAENRQLLNEIHAQWKGYAVKAKQTVQR